MTLALIIPVIKDERDGAVVDIVYSMLEVLRHIHAILAVIHGQEGIIRLFLCIGCPRKNTDSLNRCDPYCSYLVKPFTDAWLHRQSPGLFSHKSHPVLFSIRSPCRTMAVSIAVSQPNVGIKVACLGV